MNIGAVQAVSTESGSKARNVGAVQTIPDPGGGGPTATFTPKIMIWS